MKTTAAWRVGVSVAAASAYCLLLSLSWAASSYRGGPRADVATARSACAVAAAGFRDESTRAFVAEGTPAAASHSRAAGASLEAYADASCPYSEFMAAVVASRETARTLRVRGGLRVL